MIKLYNETVSCHPKPPTKYSFLGYFASFRNPEGRQRLEERAKAARHRREGSGLRQGRDPRQEARQGPQPPVFGHTDGQR